MIFRQLFDQTSGTYSYLLASRRGGEALIIDPVLEKVDRYLSLVRELDLKLVKAVDTHMHADHITGLGALRDKTHCITVMGEQTKADVVSMRLADGEQLEGVVSYVFDNSVTLGVGARYWKMEVPNGTAHFEELVIGGAIPQVEKMKTERYGMFVQLGYKY